jgi:Meiotically up-regulated gene 113
MTMGDDDADCWLYVMGLPDGPQKIGWSYNPARRVYPINRQSNTNAALVGQVPVSPGRALHAERYAHWLLRDHHYRAEWFNVSAAEALKAIETAAKYDWSEMADGYILIPPVNKRGGKFNEIASCKLANGLGTRITRVLDNSESKSDFIRLAVDRELAHREAAQRKPGKPRRK